MAPTTYGDLGKSARDVIGKGYHFSLLKLELKTKTASGVEFTSGGSSNTDSGKVDGTLETKYKFSEYGTTFTEKWNTSNQLSTTVDVQDKILKGLKVTFDSTFSPQTGAKSGKVKAEYKHDLVTVNSDVDINLGGPLVNASAVVGHKGWLAGYQVAIDTGKSKLTKNNFCLGYSTGDFVLHTNVNDGQVFGGSVYQKVNPNLETAVNLGWTANKNETSFGIGAKYVLDKNASLRAKVNNSSQIGLGYQQKLRDGVTLTLSTLIDGKNVQQGGHKLGLALELEA
jgi:voltage-dependent anion channel protein 2